MTRDRYTEQARLRDLRQLGLDEDATEAEIKAAHRKLVKARHPDRFSADDPERAAAENEVKRANAAYTRLRSHPGAAVRPKASTPQRPGPGPRRPAAASARPPASPPTGRWQSEYASEEPVEEADEESAWGRGRQRAAPLVLLALAALCLWMNVWRPFERRPAPTPAGLVSAIPTASKTPLTRTPEPANDPPSENWHPLAREGMFAAGSTESEVLELQGRPSAVMGRSWFYGTSVVLFDRGRVSGYAIKDTHLNVGFDARRASAAVFRVGSTKDEVLAIQGAPTFMEERSWGYGYSRIEFDDEDRVTGYAVMDVPLKVR